MNRSINLRTRLSAVALGVASCLPGSVSAQHLVIGLSPHQSPQEATQEVKDIGGFLVTLEPGDSAAVLDAYNVTTLGTLEVPKDKRYRSPRAILAKNRPVMQKMMRFAKAAKPSNGGSVLPLPDAVNLPALLDHAAENRQGEEPVDIVILGSPFYSDHREPGFAMVDGRYPADGHLSHNRGETPYGIDAPDKYAGLRVHLAYDGDTHMENTRHAVAVERWWTLNIESQGGQLVSFTNDLPTAIARVKSGARPPRHQYKVRPGDKMEMIRLRPVEIEQSIHERDLTTTPLPQETAAHARNVEVGLSWDNCDSCDLDLYVRPRDGADVLFFNRNKTADGVFFKDYLSSPHATGAYETVALDVPVDLGKLQVAVNFYRGDAPQGVRGEVRIAVDGATYAQRFQLNAKQGNGGAGVQDALDARRSTRAQTLLIDPLGIAALR